MTTPHGPRGDGGAMGAAFVPAAVTSQENFAAMDLDRARDAVSAMSPELIEASAQAWHEVGADITAAVDDFVQTVTEALRGWEGPAAAGTGSGLLACARRTGELGAVATMIGDKVDEAWSGFDQTKRLVELIPEPSSPTRLHRGSFADVKLADYERDEADMQAADIMRTIYGAAVVQADTDVPDLPPPFDPTAPGPAR